MRISIEEIVKYYQPFVYQILNQMRAEKHEEMQAAEKYDETEDPEFKFYKHLMEERKGVELLLTKKKKGKK